MWCVAGLFLGIVLRGTALPVGIGLVWVLVVEQIIRAWFAPAVAAIDVLQRWLPGTNAGSLVAALGVHTEQQGVGAHGVNTIVDRTHAALVVIGYAIALVAASAAVVRHRDVTGLKADDQKSCP